MPELPRGTQILINYRAGELTLDEMRTNRATKVGFITSGPTKDGAYFCRYWNESLLELRTKSCSETTPMDMILVVDTVPQEQVDKALEEHC